MPLYRMHDDAIMDVPATTLANQKVLERHDLQRLLADRINILVPGGMVLTDEFGAWEDSLRRIDLLCVDGDGNLVVVELKRGATGSHMELQALRYAAMVSTLTFEQAVEVYARYLTRLGREGDARARLLEFLERDEADDSSFAKEVRIVLVSEDFGKELTTAVLWLNGRGLVISCVRLLSYDHAGEHLIQLERIIPLPEAAEYQSRVRNKEQEVRRAEAQRREPAPELLAAVEAYDAIAEEGFETCGHAWNYRQIRPTSWNSNSVHYEFLLASRKHLGVELHIESVKTQPVAEVLRPLAGERLAGVPVPLEWDPGWRSGKGRLTCRLPLDTAPEVAADTMAALIARTHDLVTRRLKELAATELGDDE